MKKQYDVIIVGAGPAGLMVAQIAAGSGLQVLLVEQKKEIPKILRSCCCNLIIEPNTHKENVTYANGEINFEKNSFSVPYHSEVIPLDSSVKVSPGGSTLRIKGKSPEGFVAISYEKEMLMQRLLAKAVANRVDILYETQGVSAENIKGGVRVTLRDRAKNFTVTGRTAVAADGVNSRIVESLDLNRKRRKQIGRFRVASYHMQGVQCPYPYSWITFVGKGHAKGGKGQYYMCPKPHAGKREPLIYELTCGCPVVGKMALNSAQEELDHFVTKGRFAPWFADMEIVETRAATLNFYTPLTNPIEGNVVVVGDAASFIETYVQGALMYGFQAGNAIVKYLKTGKGLKDYAKAWQTSFEYNNPEEIKLATQGFGLHVLKDDDLDYLFSLTKGDQIVGFVNEFSDPITTRTALFKHLEQVKKERPELGAKLQKFKDVSVADALQVE